MIPDDDCIPILAFFPYEKVEYVYAYINAFYFYFPLNLSDWKDWKTVFYQYMEYLEYLFRSRGYFDLIPYQTFDFFKKYYSFIKNRDDAVYEVESNRFLLDRYWLESDDQLTKSFKSWVKESFNIAENWFSNYAFTNQEKLSIKTKNKAI